MCIRDRDYGGQFAGAFTGDQQYAGVYGIATYVRLYEGELFPGEPEVFVASYVGGTTKTYAGAAAYVSQWSRTYLRTGGEAGLSFIKTYVGTWVPTWEGQYAGNYVRNYDKAWERVDSSNYTKNFLKNWARAYTKNYVRQYQKNYDRTFSVTEYYIAEYTGYYSKAYTKTYLGQYTKVWVGQYTKQWTGQYLGLASYGTSTDGTGQFSGMRPHSFTGTFDGATYQGVFNQQFEGTFGAQYVKAYEKAYVGQYENCLLYTSDAADEEEV